MAITLNAVQRAYWERLRVLELELGQLHLALRKLAMEIIAHSGLSIKISGQIVRAFADKKEKLHYITKHSRKNEWADDDIVHVIANALGYKPNCYLYGINKNFEKESLLAGYEVFEQRNPTGLNIELEHISVMKSENALAHEGKHWQLRGETTPGDGNCLYHAFAQQIQKDRTNMDLSETANTLYVDSAATAKLISHFKIFEIIDKRDQNNEDKATRQLQFLNTQQLIDIYNEALKYVDGDTYLKNRPDVADAEFRAKGHAQFVRAAVDGNGYATSLESELRKELIHMLAKEAWRNPRAAYELDKYVEQIYRQKDMERKLAL